MDTHIKDFIRKERNLTFCTSLENVPHCANCFYAFDSDLNYLYFKSGRDTQHIANALKNEHVAGTILPDIQKTGTIKGVQFAGQFIIPTNKILESAKSNYYIKYPFALVIPGELWAIKLTSVKMTDNTMGFGKKYHWEITEEKELLNAI